MSSQRAWELAYDAHQELVDGHLEQGVRLLERSVARDEHYEYAWRTLAWAYEQLGRERDAEQAERRADEAAAHEAEARRQAATKANVWPRLGPGTEDEP